MQIVPLMEGSVFGEVSPSAENREFSEHGIKKGCKNRVNERIGKRR